MNTEFSLKQELDKLNTPERQLENRAYALLETYLVQIEQAMEQQKMTKKALAEKVNVTPSYISKIFQSEKLINFKMLVRMEKALGLDFIEQEPKQEKVKDFSIKFSFQKKTSPASTQA